MPRSPGKDGPPLPEGFAEFVRLYLTNPGEAIDKAPGFNREFEKKLAEMPQLQAVLRETRQDVRRYVEQPAAAKVESRISFEKTKRSRLNWSGFYTAMVDSIRPIREAVAAMGETPDASNAALLAQAFQGWAGKSNWFLDRQTFDANTHVDNGEGLRTILRAADGWFKDLSVYLVARRDIEKGNQGIETGTDSLDVSRAAIREIEKKHPEVKEIAPRLYAYQDRLLQYIVDSDLLGAEDAKRIRAMNQNYVPFFRVMDELSGKGGGSGKGMADVQSPTKKMQGSARDIVDPLESIVKNTYTLINLAERNRVALALTRQAERTEGSGRWVERVPPKMIPQSFTVARMKAAMEQAGVDPEGITESDMDAVATIFSPLVSGSAKENIISVLADGKTRLYHVQPELYRALKSLDEEQANMLIRILSYPAKLKRAGATGLNPEFAAFSNPGRDTMTAFLQSRNRFIPVVDTVKGLYSILRDDQYAERWQKAGGQHAALTSMDRTTIQQNFRAMTSSKGQFVWHHPIEAFRMLLELSDAATRVGEFRRAVDKGKTDLRGAVDARNVSLDFARMGTAVKSMNLITAFFNAGIQGTDRFLKTHKRDPKGTLIKGMVGVTLPSLLLQWINEDDEDYRELPRWQKDFFWMVPTKGVPGLYEKTKFLRIPKPFLWGVAYGSVAERLSEWIRTQDPSAFDGILNSLYQTSAPPVVPDFLVGGIEHFSNRSLFTGRKITPGYLERLPQEHQFHPWTSEISKGMSSMARMVGAEVSPIEVENFMLTHSASVGRMGLKAADVVARQFTEGPERPTSKWSDWPFVRVFSVRTEGATESMGKLYRELGKLSAKDAAIKFARKYKGRIKAKPMTRSERRRFRVLRHSQRRLSEISARIRKVESSKRSATAKRKQIDGLNGRRRDVARKAMTRVRKIQ